MKNVVMLTLIFVALAFSQTKVLACSCPQVVSLEQNIRWQLKNDKAVFVGKLIEIKDKLYYGDRLIKFQVEQIWKGALSDEITVATENVTNSCAYPFEEGKSYLIFAVSSDRDILMTGGCLPNREVSRATEELKILGKGTKPKKAKSQMKPNKLLP